MRTPVTYYGGKQRLAPLIRTLLPPHMTYVEPFCGGAAVYFAKQVPHGVPAYREVLNDLDPALINFWTQLRDAPTELQAALLLTPYSESEFQAAQTIEGSALERARRYFVCAKQSYSSTKSSWGRRVIGVPPAYQWAGQIEAILPATERIARAEIWLGDALAMFDRYDAPDTLFYCDPPYTGTHSDVYVNAYQEDDWCRLVDRLERLEGSFMLSHYPATREPRDTVKIVKKIKCAMNMQKDGDNLQTDRTEVLWCRYNGWKPSGPLAHALACFNGSPYTAQGIAATMVLDTDEEGEDA
jgi:DNA adenine methylase